MMEMEKLIDKLNLKVVRTMTIEEIRAEFPLYMKLYDAVIALAIEHFGDVEDMTTSLNNMPTYKMPITDIALENMQNIENAMAVGDRKAVVKSIENVCTKVARVRIEEANPTEEELHYALVIVRYVIRQIVRMGLDRI